MSRPADQADTPFACDTCGLEFPRREMLVKQRRRLSSGWCWRCPTCALRAQRRKETFSLVVVVLVAAALIAGGLFFDSQFREVGLHLVGYLIGSFVGLIIHEGAHAVVAWALGQRVWRIELGVGKRWGGFMLGDVAVHLRLLPTMGFVVTSPSQPRFSASRFAAVLIAGPLSNLLLAAAALWARLWLDPLHPDVAIVIIGVLTANLLMFAFNIWPRRFNGEHQALLTDGAQLLGLVRDFGKTHREQREAIAQSIAIAERLGRHQNQEALAALEASSVTGEYAALMKVNAMVVHIRLGQFAKAHAIGVALLGDDTLEPLRRALVLNNTAWAGLLDGQAERAPVFMRYLDFALETLSANFALMSTRGACAIAMGQPDEGRQLIEQSMAQDRDATFRDVQLAWLAAAACASGQVEEAAELLAAARLISPDSLEVEAIARHYLPGHG